MSTTRRKFIIDCDTGTDDAQAMLMALAQPDVDLIAVTTVVGNSSLENTARNTLRILTFKGRSDIPIYKGCERSLVGHGSPNTGYHGKDGLGDVTIEGVDPVDESKICTEHAAVALVRIVNENPGDITLVATGPLTNIAMALHLDPMFGKKLKDIVVMGGTTEAKGNITPAAEFNFFCDPEAAYFVLDHIGQVVTLAAKEVCEEHAFSWEWYEKFTHAGTKTSELIGRCELNKVSLEKSRGGNPAYIMLWDQVAMAAAINSQVVTEAEEVYVTVELHGNHTRGQCVIDWRNKLQREPNVRLIRKLDKDLFENLMHSIIED